MALFVVGDNVAEWFEEVNVFILLMEIKIILVLLTKKSEAEHCLQTFPVLAWYTVDFN